MPLGKDNGNGNGNAFRLSSWKISPGKVYCALCTVIITPHTLAISVSRAMRWNCKVSSVQVRCTAGGVDIGREGCLVFLRRLLKVNYDVLAEMESRMVEVSRRKIHKEGVRDLWEMIC
ncbi:predicted protein [Histoplasma capsulatum H143]|uniref:Uncharacterized protein n=1 Tax=Ajellomyces capsulatus (strain H143) TaxID=544712 RepID=C6HFM3_AJECH|nr:predicted protein [Histoplasma capsulatum H143]